MTAIAECWVAEDVLPSGREQKWLIVVLGKKNRSSEILKLSPLPSRRVLKKLSEKNLIVWHGISVKDPKQYYTINLPGGE